MYDAFELRIRRNSAIELVARSPESPWGDDPRVDPPWLLFLSFHAP